MRDLLLAYASEVPLVHRDHPVETTRGESCQSPLAERVCLQHSGVLRIVSRSATIVRSTSFEMLGGNTDTRLHTHHRQFVDWENAGGDALKRGAMIDSQRIGVNSRENGRDSWNRAPSADRDDTSRIGHSRCGGRARLLHSWLAGGRARITSHAKMMPVSTNLNRFLRSGQL